MSEWDVDLAGVGTVWEAVAELLGDDEGSGLGGSIQNAEEAVMDAATSALSAPVETELSNFLEYLSGLTSEMVDRTGSGLIGVADAVDAYVLGNYEMAEEAQGNAGQIEDTPLPPNLV